MIAAVAAADGANRCCFCRLAGMCEHVIYVSLVSAGSAAAPADVCWKLAAETLLLLSVSVHTNLA